MPNIVQVEFFHVVSESKSVEKIFSESTQRTLDAYPIKTVVRFYDPEGRMDGKIIKCESLHKWCEKLAKEITDTSGLWRSVLNMAHRHYSKKYLRVKTSFLLLAISEAREKILSSMDIVVEQSDHSFRKIQDDESHEILERIERSKRVWLFLFKSNDLLGDTPTLISKIK
ncbi:hypothetical protein COB80_00905 [Candidatus Kaiserbacteria bacterium]|nr:MAG: hypothetical protein COB80_00905 [Candidatus Kaiserbacteria bacterium]